MSYARAQVRRDERDPVRAFDWLDQVDTITGRRVVVRSKSEINCARFSVPSHVSHNDGKDGRALLILSDNSSGQLHVDVDGKKMDAGIQSGSLTYMPAGIEQNYDFEGQTTNTILVIDECLLERVSGSNPGLGRVGGLEPRASFYRPALQKLVDEYYAVMAAGDDGWRVLSESISLRIAYEIFTAFNGSDAQKAGAAPLTQAELKVLIDFIETEMENNFDLSDMAALLDRDAFGFSRAFKAATGESPHQFLIQRRLMRVKQMLAQSNAPLAEIAYATGFSNQSHMTAAFSKAIGVPPGAFRKALRA
ncbi:AraC family transcriptional regulator [uncultured Tateyamaria sp.]|uniref:helix-turn-helix domain-containing protein n=1 Tax=uncultured Tateyamaria sp. TaxID=455651 RepID=UPI00262FD98C|nr:AraC family transcriptional regulator [uncultured Tateyamaria sp.]